MAGLLVIAMSRKGSDDVQAGRWRYESRDAVHEWDGRNTGNCQEGVKMYHDQ